MQVILWSEDYGPDYPPLRALQKKLELLQGAKQLKRDGTQSVEDYVRSLRQELEQGKSKEKAILVRLEEVKVEAKTVVAVEMKEDELRLAMTRQKDMFDS